MPKIYKLQNLGIKMPLNLEGDLRVLREEIGLPVVFLLDENHDNVDNCIAKNIENAKELLNKGNGVIVGVESLTGGKSWDSKKQVYSENYIDKKFDDAIAKNYKSRCTKFADELNIDYKNLIYGVESFGMMHRIGEDLSPGNDYYETEVSDHPLHKTRSEHFIRTLFEHYNLKNLNGNLILNCGSNHNTHIEEWIRNNEIDSIANCRANYVRINTIDKI